MTTHAVLVDPPRAGFVLPELTAGSPLSGEEAADLYAAMVADVLRTVERSDGDLLVNYRAEEDVPEEYPGEGDAEAEVRELAAEALTDPGAARFEVQVGSSVEARAGNAATHLLSEEDVGLVAVVDPRAPTLRRTDLDKATMSLRRVETVLGPGTGGRLYYHGMTEPIDFEGAYGPPELSAVAGRAAEEGHEVTFAPMHPVVVTEADLATLLVVIEARVAAGKPVPRATVEALFDLDLRVSVEDGRRGVERA
ncbi:MAG: hypothetical protein ABEH66_04350 [Halobacteriales archaeon]